MSNLALRVVSAGVLLPPVLAAFIAGGWWLFALIVAVALICLWEYARIVAHDDVGGRSALVVLGGVATVLSLLVQDALHGALVLQIATILLTAFAVLRPGDMHSSWSRVCMLAFGIVYIGLGLSSVAHLRNMGDAFAGVGQGGHVIVAFTATWANDTCAYFAGRAFGKHKMAEHISPKKTWEGFAGGAVGTLSFLLVGRALFPQLFAAMSYLDMVLVGVPAAFLGPMGDLAESMLKRNFDVKDSGTILPGHGGMLDRVDAVLFVAPWTLAYFSAIKPLVDRWVG